MNFHNSNPQGWIYINKDWYFVQQPHFTQDNLPPDPDLPPDVWLKSYGGINPGEPKKRWLHITIGRWQLGIGKQFRGDALGHPGADMWSIEFQCVRNPQSPAEA